MTVQAGPVRETLRHGCFAVAATIIVIIYDSSMGRRGAKQRPRGQGGSLNHKNNNTKHFLPQFRTAPPVRMNYSGREQRASRAVQAIRTLGSGYANQTKDEPRLLLSMTIESPGSAAV